MTNFLVSFITEIPESQPLEIDVVLRDPDVSHINVSSIKKVKSFIFTNISDEQKLYFTGIIEKLGGVSSSQQNGFDTNCTHVIVGKPNRGEKVLAGIASGKWILPPDYLEESSKANNFLEVSFLFFFFNLNKQKRY